VDRKETKFINGPKNDTYLDRESIASQAMDINKNPWISKLISMKIHGYPNGYPLKQG